MLRCISDSCFTGRRGYDNWLVGESLRNGLAVIDATVTLTALHQSVTGVFSSQKTSHATYNLGVAGRYEYKLGRLRRINHPYPTNPRSNKYGFVSGTVIH